MLDLYALLINSQYFGNHKSLVKQDLARYKFMETHTHTATEGRIQYYDKIQEINLLLQYHNPGQLHGIGLISNSFQFIS